MLASEKQNSTPILNEFLATMVQEGSLNYCGVCLRTANETRLVHHKALTTFTECVALSRVWKNKLICYMCHRQALRALMFLRGVSFAGNLDTLFTDFLYQKKTLKKDVFDNDVFKGLLIKHGMGRPQRDRLSSRNLYIVHKESDDQPSNPDSELPSASTTTRNHNHSSPNGNIDPTFAENGSTPPTTSETSERSKTPNPEESPTSDPENQDPGMSIYPGLSKKINQSFACLKGANWTRRRFPITAAELAAVSTPRVNMYESDSSRSTDEEISRILRRLSSAQAWSSREARRKSTLEVGQSRSSVQSGSCTVLEADDAGPSRVEQARLSQECEAGPSRVFETGTSNSSKAGTSRVSEPGTSRSSKAGTSRASEAGPRRPSEAGTSRSSEAGTSRSSEAGTSRSSKAGTSRASEAGPRRASESGTRRSSEAGPSRASEAGTSRASEAGTSRSSEAGTSRSSKAGTSRASEVGPRRASESGTRRSSEAGPSRASEAGTSRSSKAGTSRASEAGTSRASKAGTSRASEAGTSRSSKAGTSRASEAGTSRVSEPGTSRASEAGTSRASEAGTSRASKAGHSRASEAGRSRTSDAGPTRTSEAGPSWASEASTSRASEAGPSWASQPGPSWASEPGPSWLYEPGPSWAYDVGPNWASYTGRSRVYEARHTRTDEAGTSRTEQAGAEPTSSKECHEGSKGSKGPGSKKSKGNRAVSTNHTSTRNGTVGRIVVPPQPESEKIVILDEAEENNGIELEIEKLVATDVLPDPLLSSTPTRQLHEPVNRALEHDNETSQKQIQLNTVYYVPKNQHGANYSAIIITDDSPYTENSNDSSRLTQTESSQSRPSRKRSLDGASMMATPNKRTVLPDLAGEKVNWEDKIPAGVISFKSTPSPSSNPQMPPPTTRYVMKPPANVQAKGPSRTHTGGGVFINAQAAVRLNSDPDGPRTGRPAHGPLRRPRYVGRNRGQPAVQDAIRKYTMSNNDSN